MIVEQLNSSFIPLKIIKLHGSLESPKSYAFTPPEIFNFESQIKSEISRFINQSLIIVGHSMQDRDICVLFEEKGDEIYFVNPTTPQAESEIFKILSVRGKGEIIDGKDGYFDAFFRKLLMYAKYEEESNGSIRFSESRVNASRLEVPDLGNIVTHKSYLESDPSETFTFSSMNMKHKVIELYESLESRSIVSDYLYRKVCKAKNFSPSIALFSSKIIMKIFTKQ